MNVRPGPAEASSSRQPFRGPPYVPSAPKTSQIDAGELDEGLVHMLGERLERAAGNFSISSGMDIKPEIALVLKLIIFRLSFFGSGSSGASPGFRLVNLRLIHDQRGNRVPPRLLLLYLLLHPPIFPSYLLTRLRSHALSRQWPDLPPHDWRRKAWKIIIALENAARAWELAGWGWFLWDDQYPTLLMRILRLRLVPYSSRVTRLVSYEFMNRQLVWSAFTDFLLFAVPLLPTIPASLSPSTLLSPVRSLFSQPPKIDYASLPLLPPHPTSHAALGAGKRGKARAVHIGPLAALPLRTCPICHLRNKGKVIPIDSTGAASGIALPPIVTPLPAASRSRGAHATLADEAYEEDDREEESIDDEERIFVPAQTDCWSGCKWCYYCIGQELARHFEQEQAAIKSRPHSRQTRDPPMSDRRQGRGGVPADDTNEASKERIKAWECLRCGGEVRRAWRVGADTREDV